MFSRYDQPPRASRAVLPGLPALPRGLVLDAAVVAAALVFSNLSLFALVDRERSLEDALAEHREELEERPALPSYYAETYTSRRFIDFSRWGFAHPLLLEYADDVLACGVGDEDVMQYTVAVDARGRRLHTAAEAPLERCVLEVLERVPFESLAPPSGSLVISGRLTGDALDRSQSTTIYTPDSEYSPGAENAIYELDGGFYVNGDRSDEDAQLSEDARVRLNALLTCASPYELTLVDATFMAVAGELAEVVETRPSVPCVEEALIASWRTLPEAVFDQEGEAQLLTLRFNLLLQPEEAP